MEAATQDSSSETPYPVLLPSMTGTPDSAGLVRSVDLKKVDFLMNKSPAVKGLLADLVKLQQPPKPKAPGSPVARAGAGAPAGGAGHTVIKRNLQPLLMQIEAEKGRPAAGGVHQGVYQRKAEVAACKRRVFEHHVGTKEPGYYSRRKGEVRKRTEKGWMIGKQIEIDGHSVFLPREKRRSDSHTGEDSAPGDLAPIVPAPLLTRLLKVNCDAENSSARRPVDDDHTFHMLDLEVSVQTEYHARTNPLPQSDATQPHATPGSQMGRLVPGQSWTSPSRDGSFAGRAGPGLPRDLSMVSMVSKQSEQSSYPLDLDLEVQSELHTSDSDDEGDTVLAATRDEEDAARRAVHEEERRERICLKVTAARAEYLSSTFHSHSSSRSRW
eukprot:TRINITY_DN26006_c0_g1_i1.p1 TRINITY_DN26006_c0_g1~~TRINITY_DN26006_c0_g1_i1.p1  ORF type:complete len:402 (+),score=97.22 TRINITY_DN26006_c0_g1_i1:58-1206(+)